MTSLAPEDVSQKSGRPRVPTGYERLDDALHGGFLADSAVVLCAPACDEVPLLIRKFLISNHSDNLLICRSLSAAQAISRSESDNLKILICSESVPTTKNVIAGKNIENLTETNLQVNETLKSISPNRITLEIVSDVLLRHKALQTRKWLSELLTRLRSRGITTLAILNPHMHSREDVEAIVDLFDGNLEIIEKDIEGTLSKFLRIKWMHGMEVAEKEFPLTSLTMAVPPSKMVTVQAPALNRPRWLISLVGRSAELSRLRTAFENATNSRSSAILLRGEAGVGKTRLMQELAVYAQLEGAFVLSGSASEDELPYAPWIGATREYAAQVSYEQLRKAIGPNASELVKIVPDLVSKIGAIQPSRPLGEQQDKLRFFEAITQFFIRICKHNSLVLLFDEMQYADQPSLELLEYFARVTSSTRVLTVCSLPSEDDLGPEGPLKHTLLRLNKQRLLETIYVKNLNVEETISFINKNFGEQSISRELTSLIYQRTGGNPFFLEEVLRSLIESGTVVKTDKGWKIEPIQEIVVPQSVKSALKARLRKLGPEVTDILTLGAVIGSDFDFGVLRWISQLSEDELLQHLETALSVNLILEVPNQRGIFRFSDTRVRELLLDEISQIRKSKYHLRIAETMVQLYSKNLDRYAESISKHFSEGGDVTRTIKYSVMAGERNTVIHAYGQAAENFKLALDLMDLEGEEDEARGVILEKLAGSYGLSAQFKESMRRYEQALAIFEKLHDFKACARICVGSAEVAEYTDLSSNPIEAIDILRRGLKYVENAPESREAATLYSRLAWLLLLIDERYGEGIAWLEKALVAAEKSGNFPALAEALGSRGAYLADTGKIDEGLVFLEKALEVASEHEEIGLVYRALLNLGTYIYPRDLSRARELANRQLEYAKRVNHFGFQARSWRWVALMELTSGEWQATQEALKKSFEISKRYGLETAYLVEVYMSWLQLNMGNLELAEKYAQDFLALKDKKISSIVAVNLVLGQIRLEQGRVDEAKGLFEASVEAFKPWEFTTFPLHHIETLKHLAAIYTAQGQLEKADETAKWTRRLAETLKSDAALALALEAEATQLLAAGDKNGAKEAYLKSLSLWETTGWPYYTAKANAAYTDAFMETDPDGSKKRLVQAAETFRKLGAKRDLEKAERKLSKRT